MPFDLESFDPELTTEGLMAERKRRGHVVKGERRYFFVKWRQRSYCGEVTRSHASKRVLLMGWVDAIRDHGQLLFIHLRDTSGIVQVVFDPDVHRESYDTARGLREEYIIQLTGRVAPRESGTENPHLKTGDVEVFAEEMAILSASKSLPFHLSEKTMVFGEEIAKNPHKVDEELRLQYRYLDLRRPSMQHFHLYEIEFV